MRPLKIKACPLKHPMLERITGQSSCRAYAEFAFDVFAVRLNCAHRNVQFTGDFFVGFTLGQLQENRLLAARELFTAAVAWWLQRSLGTRAQVPLSTHDSVNCGFDFLGRNILQDVAQRAMA